MPTPNRSANLPSDGATGPTGSTARAHKGNQPTLPQTKPCPLCSAKFTRTTHLNRHLRSHTNERLFHCPNESCNAQFTRSDLLSRHRRTCGDSMTVNRSRRKSCQACADSKIKCDLMYPCSKCKSRGKECIFLNDPEVSRMKKYGFQGSPDSNSPSDQSIEPSSHSVTPGQSVHGSPPLELYPLATHSCPSSPEPWSSESSEHSSPRSDYAELRPTPVSYPEYHNNFDMLEICARMSQSTTQGSSNTYRFPYATISLGEEYPTANVSPSPVVIRDPTESSFAPWMQQAKDTSLRGMPTNLPVSQAKPPSMGHGLQPSFGVQRQQFQYRPDLHAQAVALAAEPFPMPFPRQTETPLVPFSGQYDGFRHSRHSTLASQRYPPLPNYMPG